MPRAVHPQVGPDLEAVVEPDQQVLAERLDRGDLPADDPAHLRDRTRAAGPRRAHLSVRPGRGEGRPPSGRACRPRARRGYLAGPGWGRPVRADRAVRTQHQAAVAGHEARFEQRGAQWRDRDVVAVHLADDELARASIGDQAGEGARGRERDVGIVGRGQGLERGSATLQVDCRQAVDQDDVGARGPLERPPVGLAAARPRQRGAVRVGRIGGRQQVDGAGRRRSAASRTARNRSSAPARANWAAPRPSTK